MFLIRPSHAAHLLRRITWAHHLRCITCDVSPAVHHLNSSPGVHHLQWITCGASPSPQNLRHITSGASPTCNFFWGSGKLGCWVLRPNFRLSLLGRTSRGPTKRNMSPPWYSIFRTITIIMIIKHKGACQCDAVPGSEPNRSWTSRCDQWGNPSYLIAYNNLSIYQS